MNFTFGAQGTAVASADGLPFSRGSTVDLKGLTVVRPLGGGKSGAYVFKVRNDTNQENLLLKLYTNAFLDQDGHIMDDERPFREIYSQCMLSGKLGFNRMHRYGRIRLESIKHLFTDDLNDAGLSSQPPTKVFRPASAEPALPPMLLCMVTDFSKGTALGDLNLAEHGDRLIGVFLQMLGVYQTASTTMGPAFFQHWDFHPDNIFVDVDGPPVVPAFTFPRYDLGRLLLGRTRATLFERIRGFASYVGNSPALTSLPVQKLMTAADELLREISNLFEEAHGLSPYRASEAASTVRFIARRSNLAMHGRAAVVDFVRQRFSAALEQMQLSNAMKIVAGRITGHAEKALMHLYDKLTGTDAPGYLVSMHRVTLIDFDLVQSDRFPDRNHVHNAKAAPAQLPVAERTINWLYRWLPGAIVVGLLSGLQALRAAMDTRQILKSTSDFCHLVVYLYTFAVYYRKHRLTQSQSIEQISAHILQELFQIITFERVAFLAGILAPGAVQSAMQMQEECSFSSAVLSLFTRMMGFQTPSATSDAAAAAAGERLARMKKAGHWQAAFNSFARMSGATSLTAFAQTVTLSLLDKTPKKYPNAKAQPKSGFMRLFGQVLRSQLRVRMQLFLKYMNRKMHAIRHDSKLRPLQTNIVRRVYEESWKNQYVVLQEERKYLEDVIEKLRFMVCAFRGCERAKGGAAAGATLTLADSCKGDASQLQQSFKALRQEITTSQRLRHYQRLLEEGSDGLRRGGNVLVSSLKLMRAVVLWAINIPFSYVRPGANVAEADVDANVVRRIRAEMQAELDRVRALLADPRYAVYRHEVLSGFVKELESKKQKNNPPLTPYETDDLDRLRSEVQLVEGQLRDLREAEDKVIRDTYFRTFLNQDSTAVQLSLLRDPSFTHLSLNVGELARKIHHTSAEHAAVLAQTLTFCSSGSPGLVKSFFENLQSEQRDVLREALVSVFKDYEGCDDELRSDLGELFPAGDQGQLKAAAVDWTKWSAKLRTMAARSLVQRGSNTWILLVYTVMGRLMAEKPIANPDLAPAGSEVSAFFKEIYKNVAWDFTNIEWAAKSLFYQYTDFRSAFHTIFTARNAHQKAEEYMAEAIKAVQSSLAFARVHCRIPHDVHLQTGLKNASSFQMDLFPGTGRGVKVHVHEPNTRTETFSKPALLWDEMYSKYMLWSQRSDVSERAKEVLAYILQGALASSNACESTYKRHAPARPYDRYIAELAMTCSPYAEPEQFSVLTNTTTEHTENGSAGLEDLWRLRIVDAQVGTNPGFLEVAVTFTVSSDLVALVDERLLGFSVRDFKYDNAESLVTNVVRLLVEKMSGPICEFAINLLLTVGLSWKSYLMRQISDWVAKGTFHDVFSARWVASLLGTSLLKGAASKIVTELVQVGLGALLAFMGFPRAMEQVREAQKNISLHCLQHLPYGSVYKLRMVLPDGESHPCVALMNQMASTGRLNLQSLFGCASAVYGPSSTWVVALGEALGLAQAVLDPVAKQHAESLLSAFLHNQRLSLVTRSQWGPSMHAGELQEARDPLVQQDILTLVGGAKLEWASLERTFVDDFIQTLGSKLLAVLQYLLRTAHVGSQSSKRNALWDEEVEWLAGWFRDSRMLFGEIMEAFEAGTKVLVSQCAAGLDSLAKVPIFAKFSGRLANIRDSVVKTEFVPRKLTLFVQEQLGAEKTREAIDIPGVGASNETGVDQNPDGRTDDRKQDIFGLGAAAVEGTTGEENTEQWKSPDTFLASMDTQLSALKNQPDGDGDRDRDRDASGPNSQPRVPRTVLQKLRSGWSDMQLALENLGKRLNSILREAQNRSRATKSPGYEETPLRRSLTKLRLFFAPDPENEVAVDTDLLSFSVREGLEDLTSQLKAQLWTLVTTIPQQLVRLPSEINGLTALLTSVDTEMVRQFTRSQLRLDTVRRWVHATAELVPDGQTNVLKAEPLSPGTASPEARPPKVVADSKAPLLTQLVACFDPAFAGDRCAIFANMMSISNAMQKLQGASERNWSKMDMDLLPFLKVLGQTMEADDVDSLAFQVRDTVEGMVTELHKIRRACQFGFFKHLVRADFRQNASSDLEKKKNKYMEKLCTMFYNEGLPMEKSRAQFIEAMSAYQRVVDQTEDPETVGNDKSLRMEAAELELIYSRMKQFNRRRLVSVYSSKNNVSQPPKLYADTVDEADLRNLISSSVCKKTSNELLFLMDVMGEVGRSYDIGSFEFNNQPKWNFVGWSPQFLNNLNRLAAVPPSMQRHIMRVHELSEWDKVQVDIFECCKMKDILNLEKGKGVDMKKCQDIIEGRKKVLKQRIEQSGQQKEERVRALAHLTNMDQNALGQEMTDDEKYLRGRTIHLDVTLEVLLYKVLFMVDAQSRAPTENDKLAEALFKYVYQEDLFVGEDKNKKKNTSDKQFIKQRVQTWKHRLRNLAEINGVFTEESMLLLQLIDGRVNKLNSLRSGPKQQAYLVEFLKAFEIFKVHWSA